MTLARTGFFRSAFTILLGFLLIATIPAAHAGGGNDAALVMDAESGRVLYARSGDAPRAPASLTKMMTLFLLFDYMDATGARLSDTLTASAEAAAQKPTKLGLSAGESLTIEQAIYAIVIQSANDVAVTIAEHIGSSVPKFAAMMNAKARALGMRHTNFRNPSGLPDNAQVTTARDMAILARALMRTHPHMFLYFSATTFTWKGVTTRTHNRVLTSFAGANGIKTGYTKASGFNLTTSAQRDGKRLIGVVLGGDSWALRDAEMKTMLEAWFDQLQTRPTLVASYSGLQPRSVMADAGEVTPRAPVAVAEMAEEDEDSGDAVATPAPVAPIPAPVAVAAAPEEAPAAEARRILAMAPIPDEAPAVPAPAAKPIRTQAVAYYVPVPSAKPGAVAKADTGRQLAKAKTKNTELAEGDTDVVVPRAKPTEDRTIPLNTLASTDTDDIATLIAAGYSKDDNGTVRSARISGDWGIQIGAFDSKKSAQTELNRARKTAKKSLKAAEDIVTSIKSDGKTLYRARFTGLTNAEAAAACKTLKGGKFKCVTFSNDTASAN